jgi:hypothetical protein
MKAAKARRVCSRHFTVVCMQTAAYAEYCVSFDVARDQHQPLPPPPPVRWRRDATAEDREKKKQYQKQYYVKRKAEKQRGECSLSASSRCPGLQPIPHPLLHGFCPQPGSKSPRVKRAFGPTCGQTIVGSVHQKMERPPTSILMQSRTLRMMLWMLSSQARAAMKSSNLRRLCQRVFGPCCFCISL